jgi:hypothetical protein
MEQSMFNTLTEYLCRNGSSELNDQYMPYADDGAMTDADVAALGDWASNMVRSTHNPNWRRAYALIREGTDLLLRRRARGGFGDVPAYRKPVEGASGYIPTEAKCLIDVDKTAREKTR